MRHPPKWMDKFLEFILRERFTDEVIGDLHEWFYWKQEDYGAGKLKFLYFWNVFRAIRFHQLKTIKNLLVNSIDNTMLNNNIKIGLRSLLQSRFYTLINVFGLTVGLVSFMLIYAFISYEYSYNDFHPKKGEIYRMLRKNLTSGERERPLPSPVSNAFLRDFEGAIEFARFGQDPVYVKLEDQNYYESEFYWSDASVIQVFDLPFIYGNPDEALTERNTVVLTRSISELYFGVGVNPVGNSLPIKIYDGDVEMQMRIDGVIEDLPSNSDLPFRILASMSSVDEMYSHIINAWWLSWLHVYVYIPDEGTLERIKKAVPTVIERELGDEITGQMTFEFQPLSHIHLHSEGVHGSLTNGSIRQVTILAIVGIFILMVASINYLNLVSARISRRKKEVGIRRVMGARSGQIGSQFFVESSIAVVFSFLSASLLTLTLWPLFTDLLQKDIPVHVLRSKETIIHLSFVILVAVLVYGAYPAWLASVIPSKGLVNKQTAMRGRRLMQKGLVTLQFGITVFLMVSSVLIFRQVNYMSQKNLGFRQDQLVSIKVEDKDSQKKIDLIKQSMQEVTGVLQATTSSESLPSAMNNGAEMYWGQSEAAHAFAQIVAIDEYFFETLGIPFLEGSNFTATTDTSATGPIIINQAAARLMGMDAVVGTSIGLPRVRRNIVGVVENYHYQSLKDQVKPIVFVFGKPGLRQSPDNILLRLSGHSIAESIGALEDIWNDFSKNEAFDYHFVDEAYAKLYESDRRFFQVFSLFTVLSILVSCLGLYGIVLFATEERSKEISIRKVLGSSVLQVTTIISKRFLVLIIMGLLLGLPTALIFIINWLEQFSYRLMPEPGYVILALVFVVASAGFTIGLNTLKAAMSNPVNYLRDE